MTLIFDVDVAAIDEPAAPARRCDVRFVRALPGAAEADHEELTAVLVLRALTPSRLRSCLQAVNGSRTPVAPEVLCRILPERGDEEPTMSELTEREHAVLRLLADGDSTREIAAATELLRADREDRRPRPARQAELPHARARGRATQRGYGVI